MHKKRKKCTKVNKNVQMKEAEDQVYITQHMLPSLVAWIQDMCILANFCFCCRNNLFFLSPPEENNHLHVYTIIKQSLLMIFECENLLS